jgi:hypothetical protein
MESLATLVLRTESPMATVQIERWGVRVGAFWRKKGLHFTAEKPCPTHGT